MNTISVVVPVYKCAQHLETLHHRLIATFNTLNLNYEVIFVNDDSPDNAWEVIQRIVDADHNVRGINFSRNFGQHFAINAGLRESTGDWCVVMDGDLQDQPEEIEKLYVAVRQHNVEMALASRENRQDKFFKRASSKLFYAVLSYLTDTEYDPSVANFGIYSRKVINAVLELSEQTQYFPTMVHWVGYSSIKVQVNHAARTDDTSSYTLGKLFNLALGVIISFSNKPLRLTIKFGAAISCAAFVFAAIIIARKIMGLQLEVGWSSVIVSIWLLSGFVMMILGMLGLYVGRIYDQVKQRPLCIIKDKYSRS